MKFLNIIVLLLSVTFCRADEGPEFNDFSEVQNSIIRFGYATDKMLHFPKEEIGEDAFQLMSTWDGALTKDAIKNQRLSGYTFDLNRDGVKEYFILTTLGGSGGGFYLIISKHNDDLHIIGNIQGWFHIVPSNTGWYDIVAFSKGGGGLYTKSILNNKDGEYRSTISQRYEHGIITDSGI